MADFNQFGSARQSPSVDTKVCLHFESMLSEAVDGTLSAEDQAAFDQHLLGCTACSEMLADAKRGAAWMEMLRGHDPEPPAAMLERIFAQTSGAIVSGGTAAAGATPMTLAGAAGVADSGLGATATGNVLAFPKRAVRRFDFQALRHTFLQPRLAMTAAMAFFSIALTLNLTGVRLSDLRASDLKPSSLKRSMYEANAHVVRYYTNLRVVYELESRVHDLQRSSDDDTPSTPAVAPASSGTEPEKTDPATKGKRPEPTRRVNPGTSRREPIREGQSVLAMLEDEAPNAAGTNEISALLPGREIVPQGRSTI